MASPTPKDMDESLTRPLASSSLLFNLFHLPPSVLSLRLHIIHHHLARILHFHTRHKHWRTHPSLFSCSFQSDSLRCRLLQLHHRWTGERGTAPTNFSRVNGQAGVKTNEGWSERKKRGEEKKDVGFQEWGTKPQL